MNAAFEHHNRNKRGIVIDLESPGGKEVIHQLVRKADVFLTTDDQILKVAARKKSLFSFTVENPVKWLEEVLK